MDKQLLRNIFSFTNLILVLSIYVLLPASLFSVPANGLDPSWMIGINLAVKEHLTFGKDFVYMYGPLGFLWTGLVLFVPKIYVVLFHAFIIACITFMINFFLNKLKSNLSKTIFFLILLFTSANAFNEKAFLLFIIFLFFIFYNLQTKKRLAIYIAGIIALISFFIKMNTGLVLTLMLVFFLLLLSLLKYERAKFLIFILTIYFFLLTALSFILHVDLISYITTSLEIVNYYNDAAILPAQPSTLAFAVVILFTYAIIILANFKYITRHKLQLFSFFYVSIALYILFKEGFVRADGHVLIFFFKIVTLISLLYFFENNGRLKKHLFVGILVIGLLSILPVHLFYPQKDPIKLACNHIFKIPYKDLILNNYPDHLKQAMKRGKQNSSFSQRILKKIEEATVDIIPWDISYVFFNGLNYNPRPVIQSFVAYSENLDKLNANKYSSAESPDYVLYTMGTIDNRHPFWDESKTKLAMLRNFKVVDTAIISSKSRKTDSKKNFILMKKKIWSINNDRG